MFKDRYNSWLKNGDIAYAIAVIIMIIMPLHYYYLPPLMVMLGLCWILENHSDFGELFRIKSKYRSLFLIFLIFYLWQLVSLFYTADLRLGWSNVFGRLSIFVFSLIIFNPVNKIKMNVFRLLRYFAWSTSVYTLSCFCYALYRSISFHGGSLVFYPHPREFDWLNYFYGPDLTYSIHPSYLAMYVLLSAFIAFESWYDHSLKLGIRFGWLFTGVFLSLSLYFISSRAGILAGLLMILFYAGNKILRYKKSRLIWIITVIILVSSLPLIRKNDRVNNLLTGISDKKGVIFKVQDERLVIWKSVINLIKQNPIIGVGIGDVRTELTNEYLRIGEEKLGRERLNAHNQFLEIFIEGGVIGFAIFIALLGFMIYIAIKDKNLLYGLFIMMMIVFFMFETVLYRLAGVTFFSIFSFLILHLQKYSISPKNSA
jgi:O-antigen ligase